jgi:hypothetical protein
VPEGALRLAEPQINTDGRFTVKAGGKAWGPVVWVHLPGQGRFLLTLDPQGNSRFTQAGHVKGNVIEFQSGDTQLRIVCAQPAAAGGDRPLFVYHQQSFENTLDPSGPFAGQTFIGSAGPASLQQE